MPLLPQSPRMSDRASSLLEPSSSGTWLRRLGLPVLVTSLVLLPLSSRSQDTPCQPWERTLALGEEAQTGFTPYDVLAVGEGSWTLTGVDQGGTPRTATLTLAYTDGGASEIYEECLYGIRVDVWATLQSEDGWLDESGVAELVATEDPNTALQITWEMGETLNGTARAESADGAWDEDGYLLWLYLEGERLTGGMSWAGGRAARGCEAEQVMGETVWDDVSN